MWRQSTRVSRIAAVDGVLIVYVPMNVAGPVEVARAVIDSAKTARKPVITAWMGGAQVRNAREMLIQNNIPAYETPEEAVRAYINMFRYKRNLELLYETPAELPRHKAPRKTPFKELIKKAALKGRGFLHEKESRS